MSKKKIKKDSKEAIAHADAVYQACKNHQEQVRKQILNIINNGHGMSTAMEIMNTVAEWRRASIRLSRLKTEYPLQLEEMMKCLEILDHKD